MTRSLSISLSKGLTTAQRGYGAGHQRLRRRIGLLVRMGRCRCVRCGALISPTEPWDLGHVDGDRSRYAGPEHRRCNRATNGRYERKVSLSL